MKEPRLSIARAAGGESYDIPGRRKVPGGKALARMIEFGVRRGVEAPSREALEPRSVQVDPEWLMDAGAEAAASAEAEGDLSDGSTSPIQPAAVPRTAASRRRSRADVPRRSPYLRAFLQATPEPAPALARRTLARSAAPAAAAVTAQWRPLGPYSIPHGQSYGSGAGSRPAVAGRISAVAVDPGDDQHLLIAAGGGGIWETFDRGNTWEPRTDDQPSLSIGALTFDPSDRSRVFAGTGEGDTFSFTGVGVLASTDGGTTWSLIADAPFQGVAFYDLWVDPLDGDRLLAATTRGLWQSTDGGVQWVRRRGPRTWDLSFEPAATDAAGNPDPSAQREILAGGEDGVFRSIDGGDSWQQVTIPGLPTEPERIEVCHAPSARGVAYIVAAGPPTVADPVFGGGMPGPFLARRASAGSAFSTFAAPPNLQTGQAFYDWFAAVAPNDPDVLYVGGINAHRGERSSGGTWTWVDISARDGGNSIHPDQHAIAFSTSDPSTIYIGNDGGLYVSSDRGDSWQTLNRGLSITEFQFLAQHASLDAWLIGGTQDNGTLRYEAMTSWYHVQDGDGGDCGANSDDPKVCFHTFFGMGLERSEQGGGWNTWTFVGPPATTSDNYPEGSLFYPPVEVQGSLVVQAGRSVFLSRSSGDFGSWRKIRLPNAAGRASALAIVDSGQVLVGTERGHVYRIERLRGSWRKPQALSSPTFGFLSDLLVDPTDSDRLWATCSSLQRPGVFRSDDGGQSWIATAAGLPSIPINTVEIDPTSPDTVFVGADVGIYRSFDAGANWAPFFDGLPNVLIKDLLFHPPSRLLRAATQSRGVWEISIDRTTIPEVELFVRDSVVDSGSRVPSPSGVDDPFEPGQRANWWHCPDLKVEVEPFLTQALEDLDFVRFSDDRDHTDDGIQFAQGLRHESPQRGRSARVYAQIHNRGIRPASGIAIRVYVAELTESPAGLRVPNLEPGFFENFPDRQPSAGSRWQPVAPAVTLSELDAGRAKVAGFEWDVDSSLGRFIALMVAVSADNDALEIDDTRVTILAPGETKIGFKVVEVIDP